MKFIPGKPHVLELTRRNLQTLLDKLDDPLSKRTLLDPDWAIKVTAVEGDEAIAIVPVENEAHYANRPPGEVYMPSSGEYR